MRKGECDLAMLVPGPRIRPSRQPACERPARTCVPVMTGNSARWGRRTTGHASDAIACWLLCRAYVSETAPFACPLEERRC
jgi:hypothetical protein